MARNATLNARRSRAPTEKGSRRTRFERKKELAPGRRKKKNGGTDGTERNGPGNPDEITVIVNHDAYRCTRVGGISGYREPFLDLPMPAKVGTMALSNY